MLLAPMQIQGIDGLKVQAAIASYALPIAYLKLLTRWQVWHLFQMNRAKID